MLPVSAKPVPSLKTVTGPGCKSLAACISDLSVTRSQSQENWLTNRFGLSAARARIIAPLVFGEVRL